MGLVTLVLKKIWILTSGTAVAAAVGLPPVPTSRRSPSVSVRPSARATTGTAAENEKLKGSGGACRASQNHISKSPPRRRSPVGKRRRVVFWGESTPNASPSRYFGGVD